MTTLVTSLYETDARRAISSLPTQTVQTVDDTHLLRISDDHYCIVSPDDQPACPKWVTRALPPDGPEWGYSFEQVNSAVLRHVTRRRAEPTVFAFSRPRARRIDAQPVCA